MIDWSNVSSRQAAQIGAYRALVKGLIERLETEGGYAKAEIDKATVDFAREKMAEMMEENVYE